jgi:hypothetical protein
MTEAIDTFQSIIVSPEFREVERLRAKARHDEAQALHHARLEAMKENDAKWEGVVADKDSQLADKDSLIAELRRRLGEV